MVPDPKSEIYSIKKSLIAQLSRIESEVDSISSRKDQLLKLMRMVRLEIHHLSVLPGAAERANRNRGTG